MQPGTRLIDGIGNDRRQRLCAPAPAATAVGWLDVVANNHGFYSRVDYPCNDIDDHDNPFIIGVFGGSVAQLVTLQVGADMAAELAGIEVLDQRPPLVLNCASGGMKQPQSLLTLEHLLTEGQRFDAVVLIDGFNEVALSHYNWQAGQEPFAPSVLHMQQVWDSVDSLEATPTRAAQSKASVVDEIVRHWARCSRLMHDLCRSQGIRVVQLVQPNQYYSGKTLTAEERAFAVTETSPYRAGVEAGYPLVAVAAMQLARDGYNVINAIGAFDHVAATLYSDNCCHYNLTGSLMIKDLILDGLLLGDAPAHVDSPRIDLAGAPIEYTPVAASGAAEQPDALYPMW